MFEASATGVEPRVLMYVPGGGFQLETQMLLAQLHGIEAILLLPNDSIVSPWMAPYVIHRVSPLGSRANSGRVHTALRFARNLWQSFRVFRRTRPDYVVCVGSSICVPGFLVARLMRLRTVYIESITRTDELSVTGRLIERFHLASRFYVQWPEQVAGRRGRHYRGEVL
ncbi:hypothetical protein [Denitromonas iodatirespirans]|uniref:UDP-N-acetylglucosamine--LPS N-acetylglucosamine transferase n=1 Tax=Denitromonas iodatirespirans TaxID=2795389 RepID=A0A944D920_DENI1|nr:hypothetical protein [Denitromonas iodatirespirans]MBT0960606.1 hypothetical protein [Denitromonas iodatirespirans]